MIRWRSVGLGASRGPARGFTLIEVLAALAIISVGTIVFVSLFSTSVALAQTSRDNKVAADLAQNRLIDLMRRPGGYTWPDLASLADAALVPVLPQGDSGEHVCSPPAVMPPDPAAARREQVFYSKFSWDAYARLPRPDAAYLETTVVIRWEDRGHNMVLALTSCVPRTVLGG